jgi:hypothetical protein
MAALVRATKVLVWETAVLFRATASLVWATVVKV